MKQALKHSILAMATASLGFAGGCSDDADSAEASEETAGAEEATEASCGGEASCGAADEGASTDEGAEEASCGEGSCA